MWVRQNFVTFGRCRDRLAERSGLLRLVAFSGRRNRWLAATAVPVATDGGLVLVDVPGLESADPGAIDERGRVRPGREEQDDGVARIVDDRVDVDRHGGRSNRKGREKRRANGADTGGT